MDPSAPPSELPPYPKPQDQLGHFDAPPPYYDVLPAQSSTSIQPSNATQQPPIPNESLPPENCLPQFDQNRVYIYTVMPRHTYATRQGVAIHTLSATDYAARRRRILCIAAVLVPFSIATTIFILTLI